MSGPSNDDEGTLRRLGYRQELERALGAFSNLALSLSIICILAGGVTSFHQGIGAVGGASVGIGWPIACAYSLIVAATMAQLASAFPTAGGLYHWAAILGGRGWGWATAWFNLAGLVTVLSAINVGAYETLVATLGIDTAKLGIWKVPTQTAFVLGVTVLQALINHRGIRLTARLTDFSGWWVLLIATLLTGVLLAFAKEWDWSRLWRIEDLSGLPTGDDKKPTFPKGYPLGFLFFLGMLLPMYTITGFDASAHAAEETIDAQRRVPRGIVRSVLLSAVFGWLMLSAVVMACPDLRGAANEGSGAFVWAMRQPLPVWLAESLLVAILVAQLLCGQATVTKASRMLYAFARVDGVP
jgi:amino acid transporter